MLPRHAADFPLSLFLLLIFAFLPPLHCRRHMRGYALQAMQQADVAADYCYAIAMPPLDATPRRDVFRPCHVCC